MKNHQQAYPARQGMALVWVLVVLVISSSLAGMWMRQVMAERRFHAAHATQMQVREWLWSARHIAPGTSTALDGHQLGHDAEGHTWVRGPLGHWRAQRDQQGVWQITRIHDDGQSGDQP